MFTWNANRRALPGVRERMDRAVTEPDDTDMTPDQFLALSDEGTPVGMVLSREEYDKAIMRLAAESDQCVQCGEDVEYLYAPGNPEPVDVAHAHNIGTHDHDAYTGVPGPERED